MIRIPTTTINVFRGSFCESNAAIGAAIAPPINRPRMICQYWPKLNAIIKVIDSENVMKNSEKFTEPMVMRGCFP